VQVSNSNISRVVNSACFPSFRHYIGRKWPTTHKLIFVFAAQWGQISRSPNKYPYSGQIENIGVNGK
jgi:hypothetical protein